MMTKNGRALADNVRWALLSPGDNVLVAVSGGPDSLSLLHLLWSQREARNLGSVQAAHLDHGLRGDESAAEAEWVAAWCWERGIVCHLGQMEVAVLAQKRHQSRQHAGREARYAFLSKTAEQSGADKIATGHTRDDQVETVLGNILRGTGTDGLRGIPERRGQIVRPLLDVSRLEIEAYCAANGLTPRQDPSNFSPDHYTRNRIRLELLPQLRRGFNTDVDATLLRLSEIAGRDSDYLSVQAQAALSSAVQDRDVFCLVLDRAALAALHPALLRHVLRLAITKLRGTNAGVTYDHLEQVCHAVSSDRPTAFVLMLPYPFCTIRVAEQTLTLTLANVPSSLGNHSNPLRVPGEVELEAINWTVRAAWTDHPGTIRLDTRAVDVSTLLVRSWRNGDRVDPLGMNGHHKKVADIFTDAKVPRSQRHRIPIVADDRGILWIVGHTQSERAKVTPSTTQVLYLSARKMAQEEVSAGIHDGGME